jgi:hypothetical protein
VLHCLFHFTLINDLLDYFFFETLFILVFGTLLTCKSTVLTTLGLSGLELMVFSLTLHYLQVNLVNLLSMSKLRAADTHLDSGEGCSNDFFIIYKILIDAVEEPRENVFVERLLNLRVHKALVRQSLESILAHRFQVIL